MSNQKLKQPSVLIVDDESSVHVLLKHILKDEGYLILQASEGAEGLVLFEQNLPDVIITDLSMPGVSGLEMLRQLGSDVIGQHAFIVLTSDVDEAAVEECFSLGVQSFLHKPVTAPELKGLVRRSIELLRANTQLRQLNRRFSSLLHNLPELVWECDEEYKISFLGTRWETVTGEPSENLIGRPFSSLVHPDDQSALWIKTTSSSGPVAEGETVPFKKDFKEVEVRFVGEEGQTIPLQLSGELAKSLTGSLHLTGIARDLRHYGAGSQQLAMVADTMDITVDSSLNVVSHSSGLETYFQGTGTSDSPVSIKEFLSDPTLESMFEFSFMQQEDLPFPVELILDSNTGKKRPFKAEFSFDSGRSTLHGQLTPADVDGQLAALSQLASEQSKSLEKAVLVDDATRKSILKDCNNLLAELLELARELSRFAYRCDGAFSLSEYEDFLDGKQWGAAAEELRFLANKVHSLKGTLGFLIPAGKTMCHLFEEIVKPLAAMRLVLTVEVQEFIKQFFFGVEDLIEEYQKAPDEAYGAGEWPEKIAEVSDRAARLIAGYEDDLESHLGYRAKDSGEIRKAKKEEYLSVEKVGYNKLIEQMQQLYYSVVGQLSEERMLVSAKQFNEIVEGHQQIQRVPFNISRYERLIPSIAKEYNKQATLVYSGEGVRSTAEFWNSIHEILNHLIKNAVIHGLELPVEREQVGKDRAGIVEVSMEEQELLIEVKVRDDGRGVDLEKVKEKVIENGLATAEQLAKLTQGEILDLLFLQGVSTATAVDQNAGRGVGLNAVQEAMKGFGGKCEISSELGQGTTWAFSFPKSNVSLNFVILRVGEFKLAVPSNQIDSFVPMGENENFTIGKEGKGLLYKGDVIQVLEPRQILGDSVQVEQNHTQQYMVFKANKRTQAAMKVNDILFQATLPLFAAPQRYINSSAVLGMTLYKENPVLVLDPDAGVKEAVF